MSTTRRPRANKSGNNAVPVWVRQANEAGRRQPNKITWPIGLSCNHTAYYITPIPAIGEEVYCRSCGRYSTVVTHPPQWRLRCRNCTLSRIADDESEAYRAGSRHTMKRQEHTVDVFLGDEKMGSVGAAEDALLPYEKETGDRLASAQRGADLLKQAINKRSEASS